MQDPLSEMSFQPAVLSTLSGSRFYLDLKGQSNEPKAFKHRVYPMYDYANSYFLPPYFARPVERKLEPLLSAVYIGNVASTLLPGFKYAVSYELIHHEGKFYEPVPYWFVRGYDAFGAQDEAAKSFPEIDPTIKRDGLDEKAETAHFIDAFLSYRLAKFLSVGAKASRVQTDVSGDYFRFNNYDDQYNRDYESRYLNAKNKSATLRQDEISGGVLLDIPGRRQIGVFAGKIEGNHSQTAMDQDSSFYRYGETSSIDYFSRSRYSHFNDSHWLHDGETRYTGVHGELPMQNEITFRFRFEYQESDINLSNGDTVADTSFSHYRFRYYQDDSLYNSISGSRLTEMRTGEGEESVIRRALSAGLVIPFQKHNQITVGLFAEKTKSDALVFEDVLVRRASHQFTATPWRPQESRIGFEDKTLRLDRKRRITRLALPIALQFRLGRGWEIAFGAIKQYDKIQANEIVDIWFRTDSTVIIRPDGTSSENAKERIDRYISVPVKRSETSTAYHLGVTFQPVRRVRIDVGMGAKLTELKQWQFAFALKL
ncbi:MAG: hypothetical protein ACE5I1_24230, partial [bacterium]